jgi:phospholipid/cholesterol/gamma-HCH transport system permease protein
MNTSPQTSSPTWIRFFHSLGAPLHDQIQIWSFIGVLFLKTIRRLPQKNCWRWNDILHYIVQNGIGSLPIITLSTAFAGIVVTNQIAWHMRLSLHDVSMVPGFSGQFVLRELGIAIPATLLVAKAGASITAEIGSMKVTEQIDALKLLGIDPINYLVFPRFIAAIISSACLTLIAVSVTLACSIAVAVSRYHFSLIEFLNALRHFVGIEDLFCALVKGMIFGAIIPIISCAYGFRCKGGAEGVGTATTNSVVSATMAIITLDFILTFLFSYFL